MKPELCLGTAQFGLAYGITNAEGQLPEAEVAQLLSRASASNILWLDMAQAYEFAEKPPKRPGFSLRRADHAPIGLIFTYLAVQNARFQAFCRVRAP